MEEKNTSSKELNEELSEKDKKDEQFKDPIDLDLDEDSKIKLGTYEEAPKYLQDNEYIKEGYVINCTTFKKTLRSLFVLHNESVNVWSHLIGAISFFFLIWYTTVFITNLQTQVSNIRSDASLIANKAKELNEASPDIMKNIYSSMKEIELNFKNFYNMEKEEESTVYISSFDKINYIYNELKNYSLPVMASLYKKIKEYYTYFMDAVTSVKEEIIDLIKLDTSLTQEYETHLDTNYHLNLEERKKKELARWPLYIIIFSAIFCLSFSTIFHLFGVMNEKYNNILNRFDYGGISLLISGSCYPPYYYFFIILLYLNIYI